MNNMNIGWATQELLVLVERHVWRVVVLWWHATARWKARQVGCLGFLPRVFKTNESKVAATGALLAWGTKAVKRGAPCEPAEQKCQSGIAIQPVNPHTARELRTRRNGL